jgi:MFS family permease
MEIEELQSAWLQMSKELNQQKKLTDEIILQMTQEKYRSKFKTLTAYETLGAIVCFCMAFLIIMYFEKLDTWYLQFCGILTLIFLIVLPVLVLKTLNKIKRIDISKGSYKENLKVYLTTKKRLLKLQQIGIAVGFFGLFFIAPVTSKIISNKDIFQTGLKNGQYVVFAITIILLAVFCKWAYGGYKKITQSAEDLIKELE